MSPDFFINVAAKAAKLLLGIGRNMYELRENIQNLERQLQRLGTFLDMEAPPADLVAGASMTQLVPKIRDVAYKAEDAIDAFSLQIGVPPTQRYVQLRSYVMLSFKVKKMLREISRILDNPLTYIVERPRERDYHAEQVQERRNLAFQDDSMHVVGFDDHVNRLLAMVTGNGRAKLTISIVGMGGLGKTTLAKRVYNAIRTSETLFSPCWINLAKDDRVVDVVRKLADGLSLDRDLDDEDLRSRVKEYLRERRYVIFFDDVWKEGIWELMKPYLPDGENGSRVLITTRSHKVAKANLPTDMVYELGFLSDEHSLDLFMRCLSQNQQPNNNLMRQCRPIARKCCGLPLALAVLGGLLRTHAPREWPQFIKVINEDRYRYEKVKGIRWERDRRASICLDILALSINDLDPELKQCFLYLSSFPEDEEINIDKLIRLWVAEDFIRRGDDSMLETIAYGHLMELVSRSLIQITSTDEHGVMRTCRIHDLVLELAISRAKQNDFVEIFLGEDVVGDTSHGRAVRRLAVQRGSVKGYSRKRTKRLRTMLCFVDCDMMFFKLKQLRVLDIKTFSLSSLTDSIKHLVFLRYMGLCGDKLRSLPSSIGELKNLQTLDVKRTGIIKLPREFWSIQKLRHVCGNDLIAEKLKGGEHQALQTLDGLQIRPWIETDLAGMENLQVLSLRCNATDRKHYDCHELPPGLKEINLRRVAMKQSFWATLGRLNSLEILRLCEDCCLDGWMICSAGMFSQLKVLVMMDLSNLGSFVVEKGAMIALELFIVHNCQMDRIPEVFLRRPRNSLRIQRSRYNMEDKI